MTVDQIIYEMLEEIGQKYKNLGVSFNDHAFRQKYKPMIEKYGDICRTKGKGKRDQLKMDL